MRNILKLGLFGICLLFMSQTVRADTLVLQDGTRVSGVLVAATAQTITFEDADGVVHHYKKTEIQTVEFGTTSQKSGTSGSSKRLETLPSGTEIVVRTKEAIDSKSAKVGQTFSAQVDQDVVLNSNKVVIPKGSLAELVIRSVSSGSLTSGSEVKLDIQAITVGGQRYLVSTVDLQQKGDIGIGLNKGMAETITGGSTQDAIVGAIGGREQGGAIGTALGAASGAGTQIPSKTNDIRVPAETVLNFKLDKPVSL